jgi:hypothetical protein
MATNIRVERFPPIHTRSFPHMAFYQSPFDATIVNKRYIVPYIAEIERIEGEGTFTFENKSVYRGTFKDGQ